MNCILFVFSWGSKNCKVFFFCCHTIRLFRKRFFVSAKLIKNVLVAGKFRNFIHLIHLPSGTFLTPWISGKEIGFMGNACIGCRGWQILQEGTKVRVKSRTTGWIFPFLFAGNLWDPSNLVDLEQFVTEGLKSHWKRTNSQTVRLCVLPHWRWT